MFRVRQLTSRWAGSWKPHHRKSYWSVPVFIAINLPLFALSQPPSFFTLQLSLSLFFLFCSVFHWNKLCFFICLFFFFHLSLSLLIHLIHTLRLFSLNFHMLKISVIHSCTILALRIYEWGHFCVEMCKMRKICDWQIFPTVSPKLVLTDFLQMEKPMNQDSSWIFTRNDSSWICLTGVDYWQLCFSATATLEYFTLFESTLEINRFWSTYLAHAEWHNSNIFTSRDTEKKILKTGLRKSKKTYSHSRHCSYCGLSFIGSSQYHFLLITISINPAVCSMKLFQCLNFLPQL